MLYLATGLLITLTGLVGWLCVHLRDQRLRLKHTLARLETSDDPEPEMLLTVRVHNPLEVAHRESIPARMLSGYMPDTVRRMMYRQLLRELDEALSERGIESEIQVEFR